MTLFKKQNNKKVEIYEPDARDKYLETMEFSYLFSMFELFKMVENIPGHIVELGVGAGRNAIVLGHLLKLNSQHGNSKYFGFDTFESYTERDLENHKELSRERWSSNSKSFVDDRIKTFNLQDTCSTVKGDIIESLPRFLESPNSRFTSSSFYCRLIYVDTSAYDPAKLSIEVLYKHLVPGGILAIDQKKQGGEWKAIVEFATENNLELVTTSKYNSTPAYIVK
tara:strand:+ start:212 stop:883 length:672 start_codon:yes stop_codon:yes gene_type:complete